MTISKRRLPASSWERLEGLSESITRRVELARQVREDCVRCPEPVNSTRFESGVAAHALSQSLAPTTGQTLKDICRLRTHFHEAVFCLHFDDEVFWVRVLLLLCNPFLMLTVPMKEASEEREPQSSSDTSACTGLSDMSCVWSFDLDAICASDVFSLPNLRHISVVMHSFFLGDCLLGTNDVMIPLESALQSLRPEIPKTVPGAVKTKRAKTGVTHGAGSDPTVESKEMTEASASTRPAPACEDAEAQWSNLFEEVAAEKSQWSQDDTNKYRRDFRSGVEGGTWSVERTGRGAAALLRLFVAMLLRVPQWTHSAHDLSFLNRQVSIIMCSQKLKPLAYWNSGSHASFGSLDNSG